MVSVSQEDSARRIRSCVMAIAVLLLVVALVSSVVGYFGFQRHGSAGLMAACVAGFLCFAASSAALVVTAMSSGTVNALSGTLLGIILRTAVPFLVSILLMQASRPLADAGLLGMVLINYLVVLVVETVLAVRIVQAHLSTVVQ